MARVLALVDDLFFQAKMLETARQVGVDLKFVSSGEALLAEALRPEEPVGAQNSFGLLIVDLNARQGPLGAIEQLCQRGNPTPVIAFLSHVQADLAERARAAGCQQVLPRSKFTQNLAAILSQVKS